jgi:hypothetical protein
LFAGLSCCFVAVGHLTRIGLCRCNALHYC